MEFKGTKGEWEIKHSESKDAFNIVGTIVGGHYKIARIPYLVTESLIEVNRREKLEAQANAKLICMAPKLLEALKEMIAFAEFHGYTSSNEINNARSILEKATTI